ncbi:gamma-glutamyl-gamma-aminobutyrate hydrolase family protein [Myroides sp. 1354]|uniref:anthranilate synthase component II n=1 Tax=unclassified Myroides TaxID=2642485 RepID=UPI00257499E6|nr:MULTISPECIES: gamma-glutamyl-gamma-aminobutyrate hydrolase family protein [unclassified Myroides]MDM1044934.1 gamma-glutamyl-gamma-aminobutyrate hydrolase family protein [Myroides sp. R163-1]MDM1055647.1 gamma-glutamyl-gamma-aminobutyrate hydrolase family protein [Myroides sp. 1354]MDM1068944.1 gamma-glutamyl-gamma-aminobutyrate hydrolase family protein [Myroides sp. 1372]
MSQKKEIIIIDNRDSFTYNLYQIFDEHPLCNIHIVQSDQVQLDDLEVYDQLVLSPGPDVPRAYPILFDIIARFEDSKPILGVCLGHQAIGEYYGAQLYNVDQVFHGQTRFLQLMTSDLLFHNIPNQTPIGLYHSWALAQQNFPETLEITALSNDQVIMAFRHQTKNVRGIQFHPESYITLMGRQMLANWIEQ